MKYNIVIVSNENYIQHAAVMLCSLFETNPEKSFEIFLLTDGITENTQEKLHSFITGHNSNLKILLPETLFQNNNLNINSLPTGQWNKIIYYKLLMPYILPDNIDRCLFLDVDMIINDNIDALYNWELNNKAIAAAEDMPDCVEIKKRIGLKQEDLYINSGVMVCNLDVWRKLDSAKNIISFLTEIVNTITNEQDFIALYFKDKIKLLPIRWNMTTFYFMRVPKIFDKYLPELNESKKNPGIIHFACPIKPWFKDCQHPYKRLYKIFLKKTHWKDYQFSYFEKLSNIKRLKRTIRYQLNCCNILKDEMATLPVK